MKTELVIDNGTVRYEPIVEEGVTLDWERSGVPGKLSFTALDDGKLKIEEGNAVSLLIDGKPVFFGYLFSQKRGKDNRIQCTAYDQLRYLKNKDTYNYEDKTASELISMIAADFQLQVGELEDTGYKISERLEDNQALFDIIGNALSATMVNTRKLYILYDDFGKLTLKSIGNMMLDVVLAADTAGDFDYSSSINDCTYNKIKLMEKNEETNTAKPYIEHDTETIEKWGVLQYTDTVQEGENGQEKAKALLKLYNNVTRGLSVKGAFGDVRVRAGTLVPVVLDLGDRTVSHMMLVDKVKHKFEGNLHTMDLTLRGGEGFV